MEMKEEILGICPYCDRTTIPKRWPNAVGKVCTCGHKQFTWFSDHRFEEVCDCGECEKLRKRNKNTSKLDNGREKGETK